jgi:5-methylthioribose kinase
VPAVLHHDEALALIAMELLEPHIIMRKGLISGICYPRFVEDITTFLAQTLFFTSDLAVRAAQKKDGIAAFAGNHALCEITEDLIFTDHRLNNDLGLWRDLHPPGSAGNGEHEPRRNRVGPGSETNK